MGEPTLHDIAKGTTGCGDDEDHWADWPEHLITDDDLFTIEHPHEHDRLCWGTGEFANVVRCGQ